jgi:hypothetical protein
MTLISNGQSPILRRVTSAQMDSLNPDEGETIRLVVDAAAGVEWSLGYDPTTSPQYPWIFLGGAPLSATIPTNASPSAGSGTWVTLANADGPGPDIILPRDMVMEVHVEASIDGATAGQFKAVAAQIGAGAGDPANSDAAIMEGDRTISVSRTRTRVTGNKGDRVRMLYRTDETDVTATVFGRRVLTVRPVRLA